MKLNLQYFGGRGSAAGKRSDNSTAAESIRTGGAVITTKASTKKEPKESATKDLKKMSKMSGKRLAESLSNSSTRTSVFSNMAEGNTVIMDYRTSDKTYPITVKKTSGGYSITHTDKAGTKGKDGIFTGGSSKTITVNTAKEVEKAVSAEIKRRGKGKLSSAGIYNL